MTLSFRNIDVSPAEPVEAWPFEGVLTTLERGGLSDWRRLAAAVEHDPWGPVARKVEQAVEVAHPYGAGELMTEVVARARAAADRRERMEVTTEIRGLVARSGLTHAEFAARIGTSASRFSTYATGRVVPSATLMVRIRYVAARAARTA
jgi:DNA-binding transcriptional regulator YiaG